MRSITRAILMKRQDMSDLVAVAKSEINFSSRSGGAEITLTRIEYCRKFSEHREQFFHKYVDILDRFRVFFILPVIYELICLKATFSNIS